MLPIIREALVILTAAAVIFNVLLQVAFWQIGRER